MSQSVKSMRANNPSSVPAGRTSVSTTIGQTLAGAFLALGVAAPSWADKFNMPVGVTDISPDETWVTVSEWMQPKGVEKHGSDGSVYVARIHWAKPNGLV